MQALGFYTACLKIIDIIGAKYAQNLMIYVNSETIRKTDFFVVNVKACALAN